MPSKIEKIKPGATVRVEVTSKPTNASAIKTLRRLLVKDPEHAAQKKRDKEFRQRSLRVKTRGGRPWEHRPTLRPTVEGNVGDTGTLKATPDVLNDLASVSRFVKVTAAK